MTKTIQLRNSAPNTKFIFSANNGKKPQARCLEQLQKEPELHPYKFTNYQYFLYNRDDMIRLIEEGQEKNIHYPFYELITNDQRVPLYLDIEYESGEKTDIRPLKDYINILGDKIRELGCYKYDIDINNFACTTATRRIENATHKFYKHSYHLILRKPEIFFKTSYDLGCFLKFIDYELKKSNNKYDTTNIFRLKISDQSADHVPDLSVYGRNQAMRMINSYKSLDRQGADILKPYGKVYETKYYLCSYISPQSKLVKLSPQTYQMTKIKSRPTHTMTPIATEVSAALLKEAKNVMKKYQPKAIFKKVDLLPDGSIYFNFLDNKNPCFYHKRIHSDETGRTHWLFYSAKYKKFYFNCKKNSEYECITIEDESGLLIPDYEYEDTNQIDCKPLPHPSLLKGPGSTFLEEAQKGCGKTRAMREFLSTVPDKKILLISYRQNLCDKYSHELKDYNFTNYKDFENKPPTQEQLNRCVICLNSICKTIKFKQEYNVYVRKYDIIIIDEIFSLMEYWSCQLLGADLSTVMLSFEHHIKTCDYLYLLDAHLNNKLVVEPIQALRDKNKFTFHKNPRAHDYSDYTVHWYEPNSNKNMIHYFNSLQEEDLKNGKKIAVMGSTKDYIEKRELYLGTLQKSKELPEFKIHSYTSSKNKHLMKKHFEDITIPWGDPNCKLVLYSPTVSAGINFNDISEESGFNKLYAYVRIGKDLPSLNTIIQMLNRIRQLKDKEIHIFFDTGWQTTYELNEYTFEKDLINRSAMLYDVCHVPPKEPKLNVNTFTVEYDKTDWSYRVWYNNSRARIKYSRHEQFKEALINELCNKPDDALKAGRGMTLEKHNIDMTLDNTPIEDYEKIEKEQKDLILAQEELHYDEVMSLKSPLQDYIDNLDNVEKISKKDQLRININKIEKFYKVKFDKFRDIVQNKIKKQNYDSCLYEKQKKTWYLLNEPFTKSKFKRQKLWLNNSYHKYINLTYEAFIEGDPQVNSWFLMNSEKPPKYTRPQIFDMLWKRRIPMFAACELICDFLGLSKDNLEGSVIIKDEVNLKKDKFKHFWISEICPKIGEKRYKSKMVDNFQLMRHHVQIWSNKHPGQAIQDHVQLKDVSKWLKDRKIDQCILKAVLKNWEKQDPSKQDGDWDCPYWIECDPGMWSAIKIINACMNVISDTIGFKKEVLERESKNKNIISYEIVNEFDYLSELRYADFL